ncbi:MAG: hypothetical protein FWF52_11570 [Candidatus Azobacteroides sp.]|nr:hypothetical protein [Candidatus Azobacteroides sp.]
MRTTLYSLFFLTAVMALSMKDAQSQVTIGGLTDPQAGALLDLNSTATGGLLLSHVDLPDLGQIPNVGFVGITQVQDINKELRGAIVYNTNVATGVGLYIWDGDNWMRLNSGSSLVLTEDPGNVSPFPFDGSKENAYAASDPSCTQPGVFSFTWISGEQYIDHLTILDAGAGKFSVKFQPNDRASSRNAILLVTTPCGDSNTFVFEQAGDNSGCGTTGSVPNIKAENSLSLCVGGAVYLYLENRPTSGTYIWTLNGHEVSRGAQYAATQSGKYIVYGDKIGCPISKSIQVSASTATAPEAPQQIISANNGVACGAGGTVKLTLVNPPAQGKIVWFKNEIKQGSSFDNKSEILAGEGIWQAAIEDGECSSILSESVLVRVDLSGGNIPEPRMKINGATSNWRFCNYGSAYLEVDGYDPQYAYTWYADNTQIGTGTGIYYPLPAASSIIIRLRATGSGCAKEVSSKIPIEETSAPAIPLITGSSSLCGGSTSLSVSAPVGAPKVIWYKDNEVMTGETGVSIQVTQPGNYTATVSDGGCVSQMSAVKTVVLFDFTRLTWVQEPQNAYYGDQKTLEVAGTNGPVTYTWTLKQGVVDITSRYLIAGQGSPRVSVEYPIGGNSQIEITVRGVNACGQDVTDPILQKTITLSNVCPTPVITSPIGPQNSATIVGNPVTLSVTANNLNQAYYTWYKGGAGVTTQPVGNTSSMVCTPTQTGIESYWCRISNSCGTYVDSPLFTLTVSEDPANMPAGGGTLVGKICFDIVESNFGGKCGNRDGRLANKASFASMSIKDKTYTFTAQSAGSNFHFVVVDPERVLDETHPYTATNNFNGTNIASGNTATIVLNFKTNLNLPDCNPLIVGRMQAQAAKVKLYAAWTVGSTNYSVPLTISIQDCICCGAKISSSEWKSFMCHNLGANEALNPFVPASGLNGSYYQFGRKNEAAKANEQNDGYPSGWNPIYAPIDAWNNNEKTVNDPCPTGYRVPTVDQWRGVLSNNSIRNVGSWNNSSTNFTSGLFIGDGLYLPAAGWRSLNGGGLCLRGSDGHYWSSSFDHYIYGDPKFALAFTLEFSSSNRTVYSEYFSMMLSVRCIAE